MEVSNLGYQTWAIAIYLAITNLKSVSSKKLHRDLRITQKSAWHLAHRIRTAFQREGGLFAGTVETDETHVGGRCRNMTNSKRRELKGTRRGAVGNSVVVGVKDRETNEVRARNVQHSDAPHVAVFVAENAKLGPKVYRDEPSVYDVLGPCYDRKSGKHSVSEYVNSMVHTNRIESFWSMFKRGCVGTFHKISEKHLHRYVDEFAGRHNIRKSDTPDRMAVIAAGMAGKRLSYRDLIADNGLTSGARLRVQP